MSLRRRSACLGGTNRGDEEAEKDGESKGKLATKSERLLFVSAPLEVYRDAEDDEEDSVEKSLENETN